MTMLTMAAMVKIGIPNLKGWGKARMDWFARLNFA